MEITDSHVTVNRLKTYRIMKLSISDYATIYTKQIEDAHGVKLSIYYV